MTPSESVYKATSNLYQNNYEEALEDLQESFFYTLSVNEEGVLVNRFCFLSWLDSFEEGWKEKLQQAKVSFIQLGNDLAKKPSDGARDLTVHKIYEFARKIGVGEVEFPKADPLPDPNFQVATPPIAVPSVAKPVVKPPVLQTTVVELDRKENSEKNKHSYEEVFHFRPQGGRINSTNFSSLQPEADQFLSRLGDYTIEKSPTANYQIHFKGTSEEMNALKIAFIKNGYEIAPWQSNQEGTFKLSSKQSYNLLRFPRGRPKNEQWDAKFKTFMDSLKSLEQKEEVKNENKAVFKDLKLSSIEKTRMLCASAINLDRGEKFSVKKTTKGFEMEFQLSNTKSYARFERNCNSKGISIQMAEPSKGTGANLNSQETVKFLGFSDPLLEEERIILDVLALETALAPELKDSVDFIGISNKEVEKLELLGECKVCTLSQLEQDSKYVFDEYVPQSLKDDPGVKQLVIIRLNSCQLQGGCTQTPVSWKLPLFYHQIEKAGMESYTASLNDEDAHIFIPLREGEDLEAKCNSLREIAEKKPLTTFLEELEKGNPIQPKLWGTYTGNETVFTLKREGEKYLFNCTHMDGGSKQPAFMGLLRERWPTAEIIMAYDQQTQMATFTIDPSKEVLAKPVLKPLVQPKPIEAPPMPEKVTTPEDVAARCKKIADGFEIKKSLSGSFQIGFIFADAKKSSEAKEKHFKGKQITIIGDKKIELTPIETLKFLGFKPNEGAAFKALLQQTLNQMKNL